MKDKNLEAVAEMILKRPVTRRCLLKLQAGAVLAVAAGGVPFTGIGEARAAGVPDVAVVTGGAGAATRAAVDMLGGMAAFVKKGDKVVIKPNMSFAQGPESGTNTGPEVVLALVDMCRRAGASKVRVLDNPLQEPGKSIEDIRNACRVFGGDTSVRAVEKGEFYREVTILKGLSMKRTDVMKDVLDADVLISAPAAKSHASTGVSLSMKGMMGLILNRGVMHYRYDLNTAIVDLCTFLKPELVVVDASRVLSTKGPGGPGKVLKMNTIIASRDMVAADAQTVAMFQWYGRHMEPGQVGHIRLAHERGLGRMDVAGLVVGKKSL